MPTEPCPERESDHEIPSFEELRKRAIDILRSGPARGGPWQPADWEDMAQEVVIKVIVAQETGEVDPQRFDAWFYVVVRNVARSYYHARFGRHRDRSWVPVDETNEPEDTRPKTAREQIHARIDVETILDHTPGLQYHERAVLKLIHYYDFSYPDLADVFGVKQGTVRSWVSRTLDKLRSPGGKA
jgi:RNA polymerase sigma factor (sigma-70 family)